MKNFTPRLLLVVLVVTASVPAAAYWASNHEDLNTQVYQEGKPWEGGFNRGSRAVVHVDDYLQHVLYLARPKSNVLRGVGFFGKFGYGQVMGSDTPDSTPDAAWTIEKWVAKGGLWEDGFASMEEATKWGGRRAVNHFHDPLSGSGGGYTGLTDLNAATALPYLDLVRRGISVTQWVMNGQSGGADYGRNVWGYPTIGTSFHKAFTEKTLEKRTSALTAAFRSMGQVMHLVEDNTVPDHARDLAHPGDGWEEFMARDRPDKFGKFTGPWTVFPARQVEQGGIRALWDRDVYTGGTAPDASGTSPPGLNEFVNSNFLAWNRFETVAGIHSPFAADFSTIPDRDGEPYTRFLGLTAGLSVRANVAVYPWPKTAPFPGYVGFLFETAPGSLPWSPAAGFDPASEVRILKKTVWANYVHPLMAAAHGYAQTVMSLALQPARAELITARNGELLELGVRLWNLWPANGPHSVTWHIDEIQVVGLRPPDAVYPNLMAPNDPITIPGILDVAPGQHVDTNTVSLTWKQRAAFTWDSHAAVLVKAHLGEGDHKTPLLFSVPIPNALPLVEQLTGRDTSTPFTLDTGNCDTNPTGCDYNGEHGVYRNPLTQEVTGRIELLPVEVDIRGRPADDVLKYAQREDARIAEVILFGWSRGSMQQDFEPVRAVQSNLTLTGQHGLSQVAPGHWVRGEGAPDAPDVNIDFTATLNMADFLNTDVGDDLADASRAAGTIHIGVITTAGGFYATRLIVWPLRSARTPQAAIGSDVCRGLGVPRGMLYEDQRLCDLTQTTATTCVYQQYRGQTIYADFGASPIQLPAGDPFLVTLPLWQADSMRPVTFMGETVNLYGDAKLAMDCDINAFSAIFPYGNGHARCDALGPNTLAYYVSDYTPTTSGNMCPASTGPGETKRVTYQRFYIQNFREDVKQLFGITTLPNEWTAVLQ